MLGPAAPCPGGCRCPAPDAGTAACLACCPELPRHGDRRLLPRLGLSAKANALAAARSATGLVPKPPGNATSTQRCPVAKCLGPRAGQGVPGLGEGSSGQPGPISPCPCPVNTPSHSGGIWALWRAAWNRALLHALCWQGWRWGLVGGSLWSGEWRGSEVLCKGFPGCSGLSPATAALHQDPTVPGWGMLSAAGLDPGPQ